MDVGKMERINDYVFLQVKNGGHWRLHAGDLALWKPHVRRTCYTVVKATKPNARTNKRFAGLAAEPIKKGEILVYGDSSVLIKAKS